MAQKWQNCFIKTTKSLDTTKVHLILKTSVSARVPWVRIPPPPYQDIRPDTLNYTLANYFCFLTGEKGLYKTGNRTNMGEKNKR